MFPRYSPPDLTLKSLVVFTFLDAVSTGEYDLHITVQCLRGQSRSGKGQSTCGDEGSLWLQPESSGCTEPGSYNFAPCQQHHFGRTFRQTCVICIFLCHNASIKKTLFSKEEVMYQGYSFYLNVDSVWVCAHTYLYISFLLSCLIYMTSFTRNIPSKKWLTKGYIIFQRISILKAKWLQKKSNL